MDTSGTNYYMFKLKNKEFTFDVDNSQVFFNFKTFTENWPIASLWPQWCSLLCRDGEGWWFGGFSW